MLGHVAQDYVVFFALTANTNVHSLAAAAATGGVYPSSSYANAPTDCAYVNRTAAAASNSDAGCAIATTFWLRQLCMVSMDRC